MTVWRTSFGGSKSTSPGIGALGDFKVILMCTIKNIRDELNDHLRTSVTQINDAPWGCVHLEVFLCVINIRHELKFRRPSSCFGDPHNRGARHPTTANNCVSCALEDINKRNNWNAYFSKPLKGLTGSHVLSQGDWLSRASHSVQFSSLLENTLFF